MPRHDLGRTATVLCLFVSALLPLVICQDDGVGAPLPPNGTIDGNGNSLLARLWNGGAASNLTKTNVSDEELQKLADTWRLTPKQAQAIGRPDAAGEQLSSSSSSFTVNS